MTREDRIKLHRTILRARGVPERFIEALATRKGPPAITLLTAGWCLIGVAFAAFLIASLAAPRDWLETQWLHLLHPNAQSYLLFLADPPSIGGMVIYVIIVVAVPLGLFQIFGLPRDVPKAWPAFDVTADRLRTLQPGDDLRGVMTFPALADLGGLSDDRAFLTAVGGRLPAQRWRKGAMPLLYVLASLAALAFSAGRVAPNLARSTRVTLDRIVIQDLGKTRVFRLADTRFVNVLCYDNPGNNQFSYRVVTAPSVIVLKPHEDRLHGRSPAQVLERMEQLDRRLTEMGVTIHRMPAGEAEACIQRTKKALKLRDRQALERLIYG